MFEDISAAIVFDVIMDQDYRPTWDDASIRDFDICKLDGYNDIGYYASKYVSLCYRLFSFTGLIKSHTSYIHKDSRPCYSLFVALLLVSAGGGVQVHFHNNPSAAKTLHVKK